MVNFTSNILFVSIMHNFFHNKLLTFLLCFQPHKTLLQIYSIKYRYSKNFKCGYSENEMVEIKLPAIYETCYPKNVFFFEINYLY